MKLLFKFGPKDVKIMCPDTGEWCIVDRTAAIKLQTQGLAHYGEEGIVLADGKTWLDIEAALLALGYEC